MIIHQVTTDTNRATRIRLFLQYSDRNSMFLGIGRDSPWSDPNNPRVSDSNPPKPRVNTKTIEDLLTIVRVSEIGPIVESPCGDRVISNKTWRLVDLESEVEPTHIYISTSIKPEYYSADSFRVVGLLVNTRLKSSALPGSLSYSPSLIEKQGDLIWLSHSSPIYRITDQEHIITLVVAI